MSTEVTQLIEKAANRIESVETRTAELGKRVERIDSIVTDICQKGEIAGNDSIRGNGGMLRELSNSPSITALRNRQTKSATVPLAGGLSLLNKATLIADSGGSDGAGYSVHPQRLPGLHGEGFRRLSLLDVLPRMQVSSGALTFNRLDGYSNAADYQSEQGDVKAEGSVPSELVTANVATVAHFVPASEQVLADEPMLRQQVENLLRYGVMRKLETEIIAGAGGVGEIAGLTDSGNFTAFTASTSSVTNADRIGEAMAALDAAGWNAGLIVLHPDDWHVLRSERATTSNEYLVGSWANPAPPNVWGCPVVTTPAITAGKVLVLDPSQVLVLDRQQATIDIGYSGTGFVQNVLTIRGELRAGLAVLAPSAVLYGDLYE